jgi:hypothetical protein
MLLEDSRLATLHQLLSVERPPARGTDMDGGERIGRVGKTRSRSSSRSFSVPEAAPELILECGLLAELGLDKFVKPFRHRHPSELIVALGREGKQQLAIDPRKRPHTAAMAAKFTTEATRTAYRCRKWLSEPPNGWVKNVLGFRQFSMRGLTKAKAEWQLVCAALNLRRMALLMQE